MAGGKNAAVVGCMKCAEKAVRTGEGQETDMYECTVCKSKFGITWDEQPGEPQWPISKEKKKQILELAEKMK